jgi:enamine deaminase RidA (YjgF/YER057c/UK114 family)
VNDPKARADALNPAHWPRPSGYSNAILAPAGGRVLALAGQVGWNPLTAKVETDDFVLQVRQALNNVVTVLEAAGARPEHVVRITWYVTDRRAYLDNLTGVGTAYREVFGRHYPAMTLVIVAGLVEERALVEIEATAVVAG